MPELPAALDREFETDFLPTRTRDQTTFDAVFWWKIGMALSSPAGSNARSRHLEDCKDLLSGRENEEYQKGIRELAGEAPGWDAMKHGGITWTVHHQRRTVRLLMRLAIDTGMQGRLAYVDEEDTL